jgi:hypothetical protein
MTYEPETSIYKFSNPDEDGKVYVAMFRILEPDFKQVFTSKGGKRAPLSRKTVIAATADESQSKNSQAETVMGTCSNRENLNLQAETVVSICSMVGNDDSESADAMGFPSMAFSKLIGPLTLISSSNRSLADKRILLDDIRRMITSVSIREEFAYLDNYIGFNDKHAKRAIEAVYNRLFLSLESRYRDTVQLPDKTEIRDFFRARTFVDKHLKDSFPRGLTLKQLG